MLSSPIKRHASIDAPTSQTKCARTDVDGGKDGMIRSPLKQLAIETSTTAPAEQPPRPEADGKLLVKKLSEKASMPKRGSSGAAGYDLASAEDTVVPARGKAVVKTDLAVRVPAGTYGRVAPRSGLASKNFIDTGAGVIDEDYRGNVGVLLFNHSDVDFAVKVGDRIAQLVLERIATPDVEEVEELDSTERGANGYGSTGVALAKPTI
ncbi:Deoxyuridine 5'-triphosphate nucleotidohydrolase [Tetrabaena socialis]|uniref:Deoxyuridine 5'-triphosphate nucleotidohydrolase n=1 Tax=Tetrabaena socialis TaxID=47790 RepID=A0A2J8A7P6_9CHLO|nr:Deoxyuridine 5'-triphosphate nucleotidohydrolase [Tetrabaena socialis]|eukprot:PNH08547.1 Deoxyuridine 5'-triphosphate nucleotidohydrolase [Tetrabaena socialis]